MIHRIEDAELKSFNGKPKATACLSHRAIEAAVAFGLPLNEFGPSLDDHELSELAPCRSQRRVPLD